FFGRWMNRDPLRVLSRDLNFYRYVRNRVTVLKDPRGLLPIHAGDPPLGPPDNPDIECILNPVRCNVPDGCYLTFSTTADEIGEKCNCQHTDIVCVMNGAGTEVRVGFGGDSRGHRRCPKRGDKRLSKRNGGHLYGSGISCANATWSEISTCLS